MLFVTVYILTTKNLNALSMNLLLSTIFVHNFANFKHVRKLNIVVKNHKLLDRKRLLAPEDPFEDLDVSHE
jgi:hypothetical protein